ncbi:membrane protein [Candidatus Thiomargarita nelsonii]|uniref:Membrane protein n=1 Tax=Candidatus Thiomargarita nelsonii TaxID=1003181 RepID=A0A0A6PPF2_9GAMM|nr:membrane protein [Candidatus Thiomargarita nelsonii]
MGELFKATLELSADTVRCSGNWTLNGISTLERQLEKFSWPQAIIFDGSAIQAMDSAGAWLLFRTQQALEKAGHSVVLQGFRHTDLLHLVKKYAVQSTTPPSSHNVLEKIGRNTCQAFNNLIDFLAFVGESFVVLLRALLSPSRIRWQALFANLYSAGFTALPIIGLLAFLTGVVLAYQGGSQLSQYGANIFIVDLVGITLLRELAPLLTAIIVAGRSGAAYTAQIGTMRVTDEIDALRTVGIAPMELLVLPKLLALIILMPLLSAFADIVGILGGMLIANFSFGVSVTDFLDRLPEAVSLTNYLVGIGKAPVFAAIIALVGCYQGFQVSGGADSVGKHVTVSVVQAIFLVIVVDALFSILFNWLGIGLINAH